MLFHHFTPNLPLLTPVKLSRMLAVIKSLLFLEGLLLANFSPKILFESGDIATWLGGYTTALLLWVYLAERTRKIHLVLATCMILSTLAHYLHANFFYICTSAMIVPLTCAFTMMQFSPKRERQRWALQYVWLVLGKFTRFLTSDWLSTCRYTDVILTALFVIICACIPYVQARKKLERELSFPNTQPIKRIYTPITKLLGQSRYLFFLASVLLASFLFFYSKSINSSSVDPILTFLTEIFTCFVAYFLIPRRMAPQLTFLLAQLLLIIKCSLTIQSPVLEGLSAFAFTMTTMANAQIIATHAKPGLEYTTCTLVDFFKSALAPALFTLLDLRNTKAILLIPSLFFVVFALKYYLVDYKHDSLINKEPELIK